jgi:rhodanese-related sulfurtransferase
MNTREKFSAVLLSLGLILALIPLSGNRSFTVKPHEMLSEVIDENSWLTVDQVAKLIVAEDSTIQIIDVRSPEEFKTASLPGAVNIPYNELLDRNPSAYLGSGKARNIFYSNGDLDANYALALASGFGFDNSFVMKGGMNEWFNTIINSTFNGEKISARENALFETRTRAKKMFNEINSLPDSLKMQFMKSNKNASKKLDGGCE